MARSAKIQLTPSQWAKFQAQFPHNSRIQSTTYDDVVKNTNGGVADWSSLKISHSNDSFSPRPMAVLGLTDCEVNIGFVIFDVVCLAVGGVGLRAGLTRDVAESVAEAARPVLSQVEKIIEGMAKPDTSGLDMAKYVVQILQTLYSGQALGAVLSAFLGSLNWFTACLYSATALGTILAAFATDGVAFAGEIAVELATFGFLVSDSVNCVNTCN